MDANGLSDPYACLYYGERCVWTTAVKPGTLEPAWEQSKEFTVFDLRRVRFTVRRAWVLRGPPSTFRRLRSPSRSHSCAFHHHHQIRLLDMDLRGEDDALGDVDMDLALLLEAEAVANLGRKVTRVRAPSFTLIQPTQSNPPTPPHTRKQTQHRSTSAGSKSAGRARSQKPRA